MEELRLCAVWQTENWLGSSMNHIHRVGECCRLALEKGCLGLRSSPAASQDCSLGPRAQMNQITSYLDASNVYGSTDEETSELR